MKFSLVGLAVLLSAGLANAVPNPNGWGNEYQSSQYQSSQYQPTQYQSTQSQPSQYQSTQYQSTPSNTCSCPPPKQTKKPRPPPGKKPPPPPRMSVQQVNQFCGNNNSPQCCNSDGGSHNVEFAGFSFSLQCSPIAAGNVVAVQSVCSTTVACCQGTGCIAIAL